jgi:hypothetical protein
LAQSHADIAAKIKDIDNANYLLSIQDAGEREIQRQIREQILKYGKDVSDADKASFDAAVRTNAALTEQDQIRQAIRKAQMESMGIPTGTTAEKSAAGVSLATELNPLEKMKAEFKAKQALLSEALAQEGITKEVYLKASQALEAQYKSAELDLFIAGYDAKEALRQKEIDAEARKYAAILMMQRDFNGEQKVSNAEALERGQRRAEFEKKTELQKTQWAIEQLSTIGSAVGTHNKTLFRMSQAAAIGKAIMSTHAGAAKAYEDYGYPWGIAAAAAVIAGGFAQVAQIRSQTFSGKALGGPMVGGQSYLVGERGPEIFTPGQSGSMTANDKLGGSTNVTFNIVANDTRGFDELLSQRKGLITKIIADAQLEKGRRQ